MRFTQFITLIAMLRLIIAKRATAWRQTETARRKLPLKTNTQVISHDKAIEQEKMQTRYSVTSLSLKLQRIRSTTVAHDSSYGSSYSPRFVVSRTSVIISKEKSRHQPLPGRGTPTAVVLGTKRTTATQRTLAVPAKTSLDTTIARSSPPSDLPSWAPSGSPSVALLSVFQSPELSDAPILSPTSTPSKSKPFLDPTSHPFLYSLSPTHVPSINSMSRGPPTSKLSLIRSDSPSLLPSDSPSSRQSSPKIPGIQSDSPQKTSLSSPSQASSLIPSESPSLSPSSWPLLQERPKTATPTHQSITKITMIQSFIPSLQQSRFPLKPFSSHPSSVEHATSASSTSPSDSPSISPSTRPSPKMKSDSSSVLFQPTTPKINNHPLTASTSSVPTVAQSSTPLNLSHTPSDVPSSVPSSLPSKAPSPTPSSAPTTEPASVPSDTPSVSPSAIPSLTPTSSPSPDPTPMPTLTPSASPTLFPSHLPSDVPSFSPSSQTSSSPSSSPSRLPSNLPSWLPSRTPSNMPSATPSSEPSFPPTGSLSLFPPASPSRLPTATPSTLPSALSSALPSSMPSFIPTSGQDSLPTKSPSMFPSHPPSLAPLHTPSTHPSAPPSCMPSKSISHSKHPTNLPSSHPSLRPTTGARNLTVQGEVILNDVSSTMNPEIVIIFERTTKQFLSQNLQAAVDGELDVTSVTVEGQSVLGSRRRRLQQSNHSLEVLYRADAVLLAGDSLNESFGVQVTTILSTKAIEFQQSLGNVSPFFSPQPESAVDSVNKQASENSSSNTIRIYVPVAASVLLLIALILVGDRLKGRWSRASHRRPRHILSPRILNSEDREISLGSVDQMVMSLASSSDLRANKNVDFACLSLSDSNPDKGSSGSVNEALEMNIGQSSPAVVLPSRSRKRSKKVKATHERFAIGVLREKGDEELETTIHQSIPIVLQSCKPSNCEKEDIDSSNGDTSIDLFCGAVFSHQKEESMSPDDSLFRFSAPFSSYFRDNDDQDYTDESESMGSDSESIDRSATSIQSSTVASVSAGTSPSNHKGSIETILPSDGNLVANIWMNIAAIPAEQVTRSIDANAEILVKDALMRYDAPPAKATEAKSQTELKQLTNNKNDVLFSFLKAIQFQPVGETETCTTKRDDTTTSFHSESTGTTDPKLTDSTLAVGFEVSKVDSQEIASSLAKLEVKTTPEGHDIEGEI